jgi:predicted CXXCH cytochrome family protein
LVFLTSLFLILPPRLMGKGGVYPTTKHGDPTAGVFRDTILARGDCAQCHVAHDGSSPNPFALFVPNTNGLCYTAGCHATSPPQSIYQGPTAYDATSHATSSSMVWPGPDPSVDASVPPAKQAGDWGKCVNCHDVHGYDKDGTGLIPSMAFSREEKLCVVCHDGSPALKDIRAQFAKPYKHPIDISGKHSVAEDGSSDAYGVSPIGNRHVECVDCHNPHVAKRNLAPPLAPNASDQIRGVGRIEVINGAPGIAPTYTYRGPSDTIPPVTEYQVCFKCHSTWTTQLGGRPDLALLFNPNNPSYHPVEAQGKNTNINPNAFVNNWDATKLMYCTDCHSSDDPNVRGPHGSLHQYILKKAYIASSANRTIASDELCFDCHRYDTYGDHRATRAIREYSRFNLPASPQGHTFHVGIKQYPCYTCHDSHGSTTKPHLIVTGRNPGLTNYTQTSSGGTCFPTCHRSRTYRINYSR